VASSKKKQNADSIDNYDLLRYWQWTETLFNTMVNI